MNENMKILFFINQFADGGRERRMVELVKGLDHIPQIQMHTIIFHEDVDYADVFDTKMTYQCIGDQNRSIRCKKIEKVIADYKPDIVHSWVDTPTEMLLLARLKTKYVYKYIAGFVADGNKDPLFSFRHITMYYTFLKADVIVSNSKAGLVAKGAPSKKSVVIYNGFDFNRIPKNVNKELVRSRLGIETKYLATMCARVNDAKDWESYIQLAQVAAKKSLDITFLAVGYGDQLQTFQNRCNIDGSNIKFIGRRTDVEEIMCVSDFGILFTNSKKHAEGVSNSLLESMAAGVPTIATDGGGTPELIKSGYNGFLIQESDYNSAFAKLKKCIDDDNLYKELSVHAQESIQKQFSIKGMIDAYLNLYKKLS